MPDSGQLALLLNEFHFLRPLWLLALIPALLFVVYLWRLNETASAWDRAIDKELLPYLLDNTKSAAERTPLVILLALWVLSILALAGPVWEKIPQPVQARQDAMVIVYDQSLSMYATDYEPNRQTISKRKILDVLDRRVEGQTALIVYAGDAHVVTPLTEDSVTIRALVPSINPNMMPAFGSNTVAAIEQARQLFADSGATSGTILLVTDGVERRDHADLELMLAQSGYRLLILGVGTDAGATIPAAGGDFLRDANGQIVVARLDRTSLQDLAERTGGRYADLDLTGRDLDYLLEDNGFLDEDELSAVEENFDIWFEAGPWLLVLILPLGAMAFRRGWLLSITLALSATGAFFTPAQQAQAAEWTDLWKTHDQQGAEAFAQEDVVGAAALFESPEWRGTAAYRAGDFAGAVQAYSLDPGTNPDNHYNLGNAYAMTQNFEAAIAAYDVAIALDPEHADAIHNREIVAALLEQQQNEQNEESSDDMTSPQEQNEEQQEEQQDGEQTEQEQDQQQQEEQQEGEESEEQEQTEQQQNSDQEQQEEQQPGEQPNQSNAETESQESLEQWLRRIDDDPGELMQRKFQFEYRRRQLDNRASTQTDGQIW